MDSFWEDVIPSAENIGKAIVTSDKIADYSTPYLSLGNPPLPPVMWTEDFFTFYISVPQNPDNDKTYYIIDWGDGTSSGWIGPYNPGVTVSISHVWSEEGTYQIKAKAKDEDAESKYAVYSLSLSSDLNFFGIEIGYVDLIYTFTIYWKGDSGDYFIFIDWGDGHGEWIGPYSEQPVLFSYEWNSPGKYVLRLRFKDIFGQYSEWVYFTITILNPSNNAPDKPIVHGPTGLKPRMEYTFTAVATDPDEDNISYFFDWGDGTHSDWTEFIPSGVSVNCSHIWLIRRCYTVSVKAKDIYGAESDWGTLKVRVPVNQQNSQQSSNSLFFQILQRLLNTI
jgi:hypothetical protein